MPVFDPQGDQVGRVRDLVAMLRVGRRPPRLLGMVVEVLSRRRIFLPMTRVTGVESGQVITTGVLNVRRFEQRPTERLVLGELLDRRVRLVESGEEATVLDVSIQQLPARREWEIDKVFVRKGKPGALRRKGETLTVEWSAVTGFSLEEHGQGAEACSRPSNSCAPPTSPMCCTTSRRSGAPKWRRRSTTTGWRTSLRSCRTTTRWRSSASSRRSARRTSWRPWTRTTRPTCCPSCRRRTRNGCWR